MKARANYLYVLSVIIAVEFIAIPLGRAAQPLKVNWICASGNPCSGGFQTSNTDSDVGLVRLHFNVAPGTPDGMYGWSFVVDGAGGGFYSVNVVQGAVIGPSGGSYWNLFAVAAQSVSPSIASFIATVNGGPNVHPRGPNPGFVRVNGEHYCCCDYHCSPETTYTQTIEVDIGEATPDENQTKECDAKTGCSNCSGEAMASYSMHLMLASLHIEDTPISYNSPLGPSTNFKVTYNQREANQPAASTFGNLGPKWTFNWLSYVTDDGPAAAAANPSVFVRGGGTEVFGGFEPGTQSYTLHRQTLAILVRTSSSSYEKRFSNGSKEVFSQSDGSNTYPRRIFLTSVVDPAGNAATLTYDGSLRITTITDSLGQSMNLTYGLAGDPSKITRVTDPFGRFATFEYTSGKLSKIIDPIGIESEFAYESGSDFINSMITPYGMSTFARGESGHLMRWVEATDPLGGRERVEYNNAAPNIASTEVLAPANVSNHGLQLRNTFYWDKKAMVDAPGDYAKAQLFHWLLTPEGRVSGIKHSEKKALEHRVWYVYPEQGDLTTVGSQARPTQVARILSGGLTQLWQYSYNELGNLLTETDPVGRVKSYLYDANGIDVLEIYQRNPAGTSLDPDGQQADKLATYSYDSSHKPLTDTDASGQLTTYTYNASGQMLTRRNAKNETTTYTYGGTVPPGYLASIISPPVDGASAVTSFGYDGFGRVRTVTNEADQATVTTDYDNLDRKIMVTYPDATYEQFQYTDNVTGAMTLDLTGSRDRTGRWTHRHYDGNRKMDSMTDPLGRTTLYGWCTCGSLTSITDPNRNVTTFNSDLQSRVYRKVFADMTTVDYLFEGQTVPNTPGATSRLKSSTDALHRRTNYSYTVADEIGQVSYTDSSANSLDPATPSVAYTHDPNYNRLAAMSDGTGLTSYEYYPVGSPPAFGAGRLESIDGPQANDTITFTYDELGRMRSQSIDGVAEVAVYDSLGRLTTTRTPIGHFGREYDGVTPRLRTLTYPNGQTTNYGYDESDYERRLRSLENFGYKVGNLSTFDYAYDAEGQVTSWGKLLGATSFSLWFDYDSAQQLVSAYNASEPILASRRYDYGYDVAGNRMADSNYDPRPIPIGGEANGTFTTYTANTLNQLTKRTVHLNSVASLKREITYDLAGNLIDDGGGTTFEWDAANRLTAITYSGSKRSEFAYDGLSRRVQIVEKAGLTVLSTKNFVWIGNRIAQERDANNVIARHYFSEGERRSVNGTTTQDYYYTRDHLGSIREITNSAGAVQARYDYDPYGRRTKLSGHIDVDFGYAGHFHHARSDLNLAAYRAYSPVLGRWISRDPVEPVMLAMFPARSHASVRIDFIQGELLPEGPNIYTYARNNPVKITDASGLACGSGSTENLVPDYPLGYDFTEACQAHDDCYGYCGANKKQCDELLYNLAVKKCDSYRASANPGFCHLLAGIYYRAVRMYGSDSYRIGQNEACCKLPDRHDPRG